MAPKVKPIPSYAVAYIRVSTDQQDLSPEAQRAAIERWAARESFDIVSWHEDIGVSGGTAADDCPELMAALRALPANRAGTLVVAKRDRLARDALKAAMVTAMAERAGARVVSAAGEGNGDGATDVLMRRIIDAFAEFERMIIKERTRAALAVKIARGEPVGNAPLGESIDWGERDEDGRYIVKPHRTENTEEKRAVDYILARHQDGWSVARIMDALDSEGIKPPRKAVRWHRTQVRRVIDRWKNANAPPLPPPEDVVAAKPMPSIDDQITEMMRGLRQDRS